MSNIIHVGLYGGKSPFGGKEEPLVADVISCSQASDCSFYSNGTCLMVRSMRSTGCRFGSLQQYKGYTRKAKKYYEFKDQWTNHEMYEKLKSPKKRLGLINGLVYFLYPYVHFVKTEGGDIKLADPLLISGGPYVIPYRDFTPELIHRIVTFRPQAVMGGTIETYQKETVPLFLAHLLEVLPVRYREFVNSYPQYNTKVTYIGRRAKLLTLNPSVVEYKTSRYPEFNEEWYWDGEYLTLQKGKPANVKVIRDYELVEMKIKPTENAVVMVTDDSQVSSSTAFVD